MQIGSAHGSVPQSEVNYADRSPICQPCENGGGEKKIERAIPFLARRKEETANRNRTLVSHPLKQRFHGTLFSYLVIGARLKQVKIIFRSGLNRVLTIDFEKGGKKKKEKRKVGRKKGSMSSRHREQTIH